MGWSCTAAASLTLDALGALVSRDSKHGSNGIGDWGFFETSRVEHADGAITGSVFRMVDAAHCRRAGGFRIEPDGKVARFPHVPAATLREAEARGAAEYARRYGGTRLSFTEVR